MQPTISQDLVMLLPLISAIIVHGLKSDRLPAWKNAVIAAAFLIVTAALCAWLGDGFIPGNVRGSILAVIGYVVLLMNGALRTIMEYFEELRSPMEPETPYIAPQFRRTIASSAADPTANVPLRTNRPEE